MKLFLDTNVLIDLVAPRPPFDEDARKLCIAAQFGDVQLWVSTQSYADAYYVLSKDAPAESVKSALLATLELFCICGTHASDLRPALESDWDDVEDYLLVHSARHIPADRVITRDVGLMEKSPIKAMTPRDILAYMRDDLGLEYDSIDISDA